MEFLQPLRLFGNSHLSAPHGSNKMLEGMFSFLSKELTCQGHRKLVAIAQRCHSVKRKLMNKKVEAGISLQKCGLVSFEINLISLFSGIYPSSIPSRKNSERNRTTPSCSLRCSFAVQRCWNNEQRDCARLKTEL